MNKNIYLISVLVKSKKGNAFPCFCNKNTYLRSILTKPKKSQLGNTMATFIATIVIALILIGYVLISGFVKAASGKDIKVVRENAVGLYDTQNYLESSFVKVTQLKFNYNKNHDLTRAMTEASYP